MDKRKLAVSLASLLVLSLSACGFVNPFAASYGNNSSAAANAVVDKKTSFQANKTNPFTNGEDYFRKMTTDTGRVCMPSLGKAKMLVVPVVFSETAALFTSNTTVGKQIKANLQNTFFGTAADTDYWQSVSSYYQTSSYGKLTISGTVSDYFYTANSSSYYKSYANSKGASEVTDAIADAIYTRLFTGANPTYNLSDYDSDGDGYIDSLWMVYCAAHDSNDSTGFLWAYTYWDATEETKFQNYSWASYDFMSEGTSLGVDAHTYIHETGHQMGLDDYYSYDEYTSSSKSRRAPIGGNDMMDYNIVDHCSFSKYCLDWITPTVAVNDKTYALKPFESSGDALILANDFNGTCFDEYFLLEYYTPTGLNKLDSDTRYSTGNARGFTNPGLRVLHIDQRIGKFNLVNAGKSTGWVWDKKYYDNVSPLNSEQSFYQIISSNSQRYCYDSIDYCLVSLVQASGKTNLLSTSSGISKVAVNSDLFNATSNVFGQDVWGTSQTDEGWTVPSYVTVDALDSNSLTLTVHSKNTI